MRKLSSIVDKKTFISEPYSFKDTLPIKSESNQLTIFKQLSDTDDTVLSIIKKVEQFERDNEFADFDVPLEHYFADHLYGREASLPAGTIAIGRVHKYDHLAILLSGRMTLWTPDGGTVDIEGPCIMEAYRGTKRIAYTHTDVRWITVVKLSSDREHLDLVNDLTFKYYDDYLKYDKLLLMEDNKCHSLER